MVGPPRPPRQGERRAADRDLHDHLQPEAGPVSGPDRLAQGADARELDLRGQRRLLAPGPLRGDSRGAGGGRTLLPLPAGRRGWAITATSSACWAWCPPEAELVALCDQDDRWHPDKLEALREAVGPEVTLAYCDMNLVDEERQAPLADLLDRAAHEPHEHDLVDGRQHDHRRRLALSPAAARLRAPLPGSARSRLPRSLAGAGGAGHRADRLRRSPLYDYVQHSANAFGFRGASWKRRGGEGAAPGASGVCVPTRDRVSDMLLRWRLDYFYNACPARLHAEILLLRCGEELRGPQASSREADAEGRPIPAARGVAVRCDRSARAGAARRPWARSG